MIKRQLTFITVSNPLEQHKVPWLNFTNKNAQQNERVPSKIPAPGVTYIQILNIAHVKTTPKHHRGAVFLADYDSMAHPGQRFETGT